MKIGFFGGTFDPIHFGHLGLAIQLLEKRHLDKVLFCIAARSPFKKFRPPIASAKDRVQMTQLAIKDVKAFELCTLELERPGVSYTIDTLRSIKEIYPNDRLYLMLAEDSLDQFDRWKEAKEILQIAKPLVGSRSCEYEINPTTPVSRALLRGLTVTERLDISSSQIRYRLKKGLYCGHLVPKETLEYIQKRRLYQ